MKRFLISVFLSVLSISLFAQDWGEIMYASTTVNIRKGRSTNSPVAYTLKKGGKVKVDFLKDNWYAVFFHDVSGMRDIRKSIGFVYAPLLTPDKPPESYSYNILQIRSHPQKPSQRPDSKTSDKSIKYEIVEKKDISFAGTTRMVYRIILKLDRLPSKKELETLSFNIWKNGNQQYSEFTIFSYMPGMDAYSTAFGVSEFKSSGLEYITLNEGALWGTKWEK
jgi:hypothetical protein